MATSWSLIPSKDLSAELRLAQAISEFQSSLGAKEKLEFQAQKLRFSKGPPTAQDVYRLTAEIDRAAGKISGGRVFGPRFTKFLQAVQKFASIGDVLIGGSQNHIACGVWTGVRFALMATTARASFVSKISEIFMDIGQSAPRYEDLAHLYVESKLLQSYLQEYFIVVVRLCQYVLQCSQQTSIGQFITSLSESKLNSFQTQLRDQGHSIKNEIVAITMSLVKKESSSSSRFRSWYLSDSKSTKYREKMKFRAKLLQRCSKYDYESSWTQLRKTGTARFFTDIPAYQEWKSSQNPTTLLWTGKIGSGKSVLLASIVDDLNLDQRLSHTLVTYFFCQWDVSESLRAQTILGSLARQVVSACNMEQGESFQWEDLCYESDQLGLDTIAMVIEQAMPKGYRLIFILDGTDECEEAESLELFKQLAKLQLSIELSICGSSSTECKDTSLRKRGYQELSNLGQLEIPEHNPDISSFISTALSQRVSVGDLILGDETLILEIQQVLLDGAQGMMLWVALQIEAICDEKTDDGIRKTLADLPKTLSETFERELQRCSKRNTDKFRDRILCILLGTARPLTVDEFGEAMSVEPLNTIWDAAKQINDVSSLLKCCGKLVSIDEESSAVRLVHHSIRQYLKTNYLTSNGSRLTNFMLQSTLANIVITYLNYDIFERQITIRDAELPAKHITTNVLTRTMRSSKAADLTLRLLKQKDAPDFDIIKTLKRLKNESDATKKQDFAFKEYAEEHYSYHAWTLIVDSFSPLVSLYLASVRKLAASVWSRVEAFVQIFERQADGGSPLPRPQMLVSWSSFQGQITLIVLLRDLSSDILQPLVWRVEDKNEHTPLEWAAEQSSSDLLLVLAKLRAKKDGQYSRDLVKVFQTLLQKRDFDMAAYFWADFIIVDLAYGAVLTSLILSSDLVAVEWLLEHRMRLLEHRILLPRSINPITDLHLRFLSTRNLDSYEDRDYPILYFAIDTHLAAMVRLLLIHYTDTSKIARHLRWPLSRIDSVLQFLRMNGFQDLYIQVGREVSPYEFVPSHKAKVKLSYGALYGSQEISPAVDEVLEVSNIDENWWVGGNQEGDIGLVRSSHIPLDKADI